MKTDPCARFEVGAPVLAPSEPLHEHNAPHGATTSPLKYLAVLASGNGSNLQAIIDAIESGRLPDVRISVVVADHRDAYALQRAQAHGLPTLYHPFLPYRRANRSREEYDADLAEKLSAYPVDLVVLAGWMRIFSRAFLAHYPTVLNIHPALPGAFPGTHSIRRALEAYQRREITQTGVMVHRVPDEGVDVGPVVLVQPVPIEPQDTLETLEARVHAIEHELYARAIAKTLNIAPAL